MRIARAILLLGICAQLAVAARWPSRFAEVTAVPPAASLVQLQAASFGERIPLAQGLALFLQGMDRREGLSQPLASLDYAALEAWLERMLALDPNSDYALLLATQVYAQAPDPVRVRRMLAFAQRAYHADPARRWRWIAHASLIARHRLHDLPLALEYAKSLASAPAEARIPAWALQMEALLREQLGEYESARIVLGGLLVDGRVSDLREARYLIAELDRLAALDGGPSKMSDR